MRPATIPVLLLLGSLVGVGGCAGGTADDSASGGAGSGSPGGGQASTQGGKPSSTAGSSHAGSSTAPEDGGASNGGGTPGGGAGQAGGDGSGGAPVVTPKDCKRGIGWHASALTNAEVTSKLTWWYSWGLGVESVGQGLEFVPMQWGGGAKAENITKAMRQGAKYLLGFNEPNFFSQANLSAQQAAAEWPTLEEVAQQHGLALVSPAVNFCGDDKAGTGPCHDTNPVGYLQDFFAACAGCQVDYVAAHWYNCDGASLEWYLDSFEQFGRPLWLTEVACAYGGDTSVAGQEKYMREAVPILEARSDVFRYSWFSGDPIPNARLLNGDGSLTELGKIYVDLPRDPTCTP